MMAWYLANNPVCENDGVRLTPLETSMERENLGIDVLFEVVAIPIALSCARLSW